MRPIVGNPIAYPRFNLERFKSAAFFIM